MTQFSYRRWAWVAAVTVGMGAASPLFAAKEKPAAVRIEPGSDETIPFSAIPDKARGEFERLRGKDKVISSEKVTYPGGRMVYRCALTAKGGARVVRVSAGGTLLTDEFLRATEAAALQKDPLAYNRQVEQARAAHEAAIAREETVVTATADKPERVTWDQIPGRVRATFARESVGEKIDYIIRYRDNQKNVLYQANVPSGAGKVHMVQILPTGKIFNEAAFTTGGKETGDDFSIKQISFHEAPPAVQDVVNKTIPTGRIGQVDVAKRRGRDIFTVENPQANAIRFLTVDGTGKILSDDTEQF